MMPRSNACDTRVLTGPSQLASLLTSNPPIRPPSRTTLAMRSALRSRPPPPIPTQSGKTTPVTRDDGIPQY